MARRRDQTPEGGDPTGSRPALSFARASRAIRGLTADVSPLKASRDYRLLWSSQLVSHTGSQLTVVAIFFQVNELTGSAAALGLVGLFQMIPLIVFSIVGGAIADRVDRRKMLLLTQLGMALASGLLLLNAMRPEPSLALVYLGAAIIAGLAGVDFPVRTAMTPRLVGPALMPAALALGQIMFNATMLIGPAVGGVVIAELGLSWAYALDVVSFSATIVAAALIRPMPPEPHEGEGERPTGWASIVEGFRFLKGRRVLQSTFAIDLNAMIFGMPRALFPLLAESVFRVGPSGMGLLFSAPAAGAVLGAVASGWVGRIRHQGQAVMWAVLAWGLAITAFGAVGAWLPSWFWLALVFLALAGAADVISAVFRGTILTVTVPDRLRGRISSIHILVVTGGPRLGDFEAGAVAALVSPLFSVVSGGVACVLGVGVVALAFPQLARYRAGDEVQAA